MLGASLARSWVYKLLAMSLMVPTPSRIRWLHTVFLTGMAKEGDELPGHREFRKDLPSLLLELRLALEGSGVRELLKSHRKLSSPRTATVLRKIAAADAQSPLPLWSAPDVGDFYKSCGFAAIPGPSGARDLAVALEFVYALAVKGARASREERLVEGGFNLFSQVQFLEKYVCPWLPILTRGLRSQKGLEPYASLASLAQSFAQSDLEYLRSRFAFLFALPALPPPDLSPHLASPSRGRKSRKTPSRGEEIREDPLKGGGNQGRGLT